MNPVIPQDKANHALYGALVFTVVFTVATFFMLTFTALIAALAVTAVVAVGKELYDCHVNAKLKKQGLPPAHTVDSMDALATIAGSLIPAVPAALLILR